MSRRVSYLLGLKKDLKLAKLYIINSIRNDKIYQNIVGKGNQDIVPQTTLKVTRQLLYAVPNFIRETLPIPFSMKKFVRTPLDVLYIINYLKANPSQILLKDLFLFIALYIDVTLMFVFGYCLTFESSRYFTGGLGFLPDIQND